MAEMPQINYYAVYGVRLASDIPLALPVATSQAGPTITIRLGIPKHQENLPGIPLVEAKEWYQYVQRADGSFYAQWDGLGCFVVSPCGQRIWAQPYSGVSMESFQVYLLGQALSFALIACGFEPIHGTAVAHGAQAVAFIGNSGFGKSTLAASFLRAGLRLVTDDQLILTHKQHSIFAEPGPPRVKLLPGPAADYFKSFVDSVPMNIWSQKFVIPIDSAEHVQQSVKLNTLYILEPPGEQSEFDNITITEVKGVEAFTSLVAYTFNRSVSSSVRLKQQLLRDSEVLKLVPVKRLAYPRRFESLEQVRHMILADSGIGTPLHP